MADENVPDPSPTRSDDQILPYTAWVPIGKSNYVLDLQKKQKNPIFQISVNILQNTNFFRAFTATALVLTIYIQQFWNTLTYEATNGTYSFELDETRFVLDANLLREALEITPIDQAHQFVSPPSGDAIMEFVNELGIQRNALYYNAYLEMVAKHDRKITVEHRGKKKPATAKQPKPKPAKEKSSKPAPVPKPKATKENPAKPSLRRTPAMEEGLTGPSAQPQDDTSADIVQESLSLADAETDVDSDKTTSRSNTEILQIDEDQGKYVENQVNLEENTFKLDQGQAGSDPGKTPKSRPPQEQEFMEEDQAETDPGVSRVALTGPNPEPTYEEFMANVYPDVHGSLKLPADEHVILEETLSSFRILSSIKNLDDAYTFGDQFLNDKSTEDEPGKLNMDSEVVFMVTVLIHQASSLQQQRLQQQPFPLPPPPPQQSTSDSELAARVAALEQKLAALDPSSRMFESGSYKSLSTHVALYEALEASMERENRDEFLAKKYKSRKRRCDDQDPPLYPSDLNLNNVNVSNSEDIDTAHLPKLKTRPDWMKLANVLASSYQDLDEYKLLRQTGDMSLFINWFCKRIGKKKLSQTDLEGSAFKAVRPFHDNNILLQFQMEECRRMLTDQVDLVNLEGHRIMPDIRKPVPFGGSPGQILPHLHLIFFLGFPMILYVMEMISSTDISAAYDISHWWFKHKEFYITRHDAAFDRSKVRSHMRILIVISLKTYVRYGYAFLKEIVLHRADYKEYKISKADFKNFHLNDFEDLNTVIKKRVEDLHLGIESYQTKHNLTQPEWDASDFLFKEDYTIVSKPRAVIYRDRNDQKKMMRDIEVHKFSDGTLNMILEKLDHMVKDFMLFKYNTSMTTRIWSEDYRRRSKEFMEVIKHRLKLQRIFRSLESFVCGILRDVNYRLIQRTE
uniref:Uncharacterized protein n=1 Tax=Tanacetum cinerariifolium TaxID=118510 RepID=A0A6L2JRL1_TANCI|nr:hypothetical protein [Tanacetum cinerariifolium]